MTHDQQGSTPANEPQGTPATDTTTPSTLSFDKAPAAPASTDAGAATTTDTAAPAVATADAPYPPADTTAYPAGGYGQPGYGQPGYGQPPVARGTDGMSIAALVTGILGLGFIPVILGVLGLKRTKANGTSGRGLAIAGIILGVLSFIAWIVLAISLFVASNAIRESVEEAGGLDELTQQLEELETPAPEATDPATDGTDDLAASATPLKDVAPLTVGAFTTTGLTDEATITGAGALEAYTASYTDGASTVETVLSNWSSGTEATAFATAQTTGFAAETLTDSGEFDAVSQYWVYDVEGVTTLIATNDSATLTFTGPADAVYALYNEYPL
ncbi:DUF4190 domain-containing protein [Cellulomonas cellasea]|uniref:DUF4190 domain-containing protein n=2 Tax=Cellulomonas cellasea TaxID=43670 RepID=A0A0A0BBZ7_9CELL|nr:DUF4190 domain-containing protein [Cellulomonas cellasea]KGM03622.1 hypothetical protein Q760_00545 [Cellulomonas cellasea DSM 20118]GEA87519.1 hypothetical protein CCE01nite_14680 [Cellulomonas cellasea]